MLNFFEFIIFDQKWSVFSINSTVSKSMFRLFNLKSKALYNLYKLFKHRIYRISNKNRNFPSLIPHHLQFPAQKLLEPPQEMPKRTGQPCPTCRFEPSELRSGFSSGANDLRTENDLHQRQAD